MLEIDALRTSRFPALRTLWKEAFNVDMHPEVKALMEEADPTQSPASWALRYAASLDGVLTILSGMSTIEQMEENYKILMEDFKPLSEDEKLMLPKAAKIIESKRPVGCTGCHYCTDKGCPSGINIPESSQSIS